MQKKKSAIPKTYTVQDLEEILHTSRKTVYNYIKAGQLKCSKVGKHFIIPAEELDRFMKEGTEPGFYKELYPGKDTIK